MADDTTDATEQSTTGTAITQVDSDVATPADARWVDSLDDILAEPLGQSLVIGTALAVGFAVATGLVAVLYGFPDVVTYAQWVASGVLLGLAFTGLAVGGSAAAASRGRAMTLTIGSFMAMVFFWNPSSSASTTDSTAPSPA